MARIFFFLPPLRRPTGGLAVLHQVAAALDRAGRRVVLAPREAGHWQPAMTGHLPVADWNSLGLRPEDLWVAPEGWVNALAPGLRAKARCVAYVQNWAYLFSALAGDVTWDRLGVSFLAVSHPVAWYIERATGRQAPVLRPGIDRDLFRPLARKPAGPVRVAWMPRKNKAQGQQARALLAERLARSKGPAVQWTALEGLDQAGVAQALRDSHVFLATGFPEGCPLPPLEAMACGCLPVGCGGFGGWDYMRQAAAFEGAYAPWWTLGDVAWGGNGLWTADADVAAAASALETAVGWWAKGSQAPDATPDAVLTAALAAGQATADAYALADLPLRAVAAFDALDADNQAPHQK